MATATVRNWGTSLGFVIPKELCRELGLHAGSKIGLKESNGALIITPEQEYTLEALMAGYNGPVPGEYDWGTPYGKEAF